MSSRFVLPFADVGSGINPPSGAQLFFLETGSSALKDTFSDQLSTPTKNSNPVIAGPTGIFGDIFITGKYKIVLKDKNGTQIWSADPIEEFLTPTSLTDDQEALLINDLSQAYEFPTVAAYKAFTTAFPVGKVIHLLDRGAEFTVIAGTGTANTFDIIASDQVSQSINLVINDQIHSKQVGATGDGVTNDGAALFRCNDIATALGGADIFLDPGTYIISSLFNLDTGNGLIGQYRETSVIKQTNTSVGGVKLGGLNRVKNIRIEAPNTNTDTTTIGLDTSVTSDIIIEQVRVLWFGFGVKSVGLTWRQSYTHVRVDNPTNTGFHFEDANINLELKLDQCYVVNNSILGLTNKTSYYFDGCQGAHLTNCTSDGGKAVSMKNLGMNIINSTLSIDIIHFEGYQSPAGFIGSALFDGVIRATGSRVNITGARFHGCDVDVVADAVLIYAENGTRMTIETMVVNTATLNEYTSQQIGISDSFSKTLIEIDSSDSTIVLGAQRGTGAGTAQYTRTGIIQEETITGAATIIDVNLVDTLIIRGTTGDISNFSGAHSEGQTIEMISRQAGATLTDSGTFKLQGGIDFVLVVNGRHTFKYTEEGGFWAEMSRLV